MSEPIDFDAIRNSPEFQAARARVFTRTEAIFIPKPETAIVKKPIRVKGKGNKYCTCLNGSVVVEHSTNCGRCGKVRCKRVSDSDELRKRYSINNSTPVTRTYWSRCYFFDCIKCGKPYYANPDSALKKKFCIECQLAKVDHENLLRVLYFQYIPNEIDCWTIILRRRDKVSKWKCELCLHEWQDSLAKRLENPECPSCKSQKPLRLIDNRLLLKEYRMVDGLDAADITTQTPDVLNWHCGTEGHPIFQLSFFDRLKSAGCKKCSGKRFNELLRS